MIDTIPFMSALDLRQRYTGGDLDPEVVIDSLVSRAEALSSSINATTAIFRESALLAAREANRRYRSGCPRPLEGVPVAVKEETAVAGWRRTIGSRCVDEVPAENHPIVQRLLEAGAILHLQTTVPEFCLMPTTWTDRFGVTRNPWNLEITAGGSSGGSGAAVAAGLAPLATGSDMAGSVRIPAAFQGLYGYKPPFGTLPPTPGEELFSFAVEGPLARDFGDLILMQNAMSGPHPRTYVGRPTTQLPSEYPDLTGKKIAYARTFGSTPVAADVQANLEQALEGLASRGATVEEVDIAFDTTADAYCLLEAIFGLFFKEYLESHGTMERGLATSYTRLLATRYGSKFCSILNAAHLASTMQRRLDDAIWQQGYYALVCPTVHTVDMPADLDIAVTPWIDINGKAVDSYLGWLATPLFNLLSRYPALAVPTGVGAAGVPTSMQIVGRPYDEYAVFHVGYQHAQVPTALFRSAFPNLQSLHAKLGG